MYKRQVQDTYKVKNLGRDPQLWNLNPEGEQLVADYLQEQLALETTEGGLPEVLHQAAEESVQAWLPDAFDELQDVYKRQIYQWERCRFLCWGCS